MQWAIWHQRNGGRWGHDTYLLPVDMNQEGTGWHLVSIRDTGGWADRISEATRSIRVRHDRFAQRKSWV